MSQRRHSQRVAPALASCSESRARAAPRTARARRGLASRARRSAPPRGRGPHAGRRASSASGAPLPSAGRPRSALRVTCRSASSSRSIQPHRHRRRQAEYRAGFGRVTARPGTDGERTGDRRGLRLARRVANRLGGAVGDGQGQRRAGCRGAVELWSSEVVIAPTWGSLKPSGALNSPRPSMLSSLLVPELHDGELLRQPPPPFFLAADEAAAAVAEPAVDLWRPTKSAVLSGRQYISHSSLPRPSISSADGPLDARPRQLAPPPSEP